MFSCWFGLLIYLFVFSVVLLRFSSMITVYWFEFNISKNDFLVFMLPRIH